MDVLVWKAFHQSIHIQHVSTVTSSSIFHLLPPPSLSLTAAQLLFIVTFPSVQTLVSCQSRCEMPDVFSAWCWDKSALIPNPTSPPVIPLYLRLPRRQIVCKQRGVINILPSLSFSPTTLHVLRWLLIVFSSEQRPLFLSCLCFLTSFASVFHLLSSSSSPCFILSRPLPLFMLLPLLTTFSRLVRGAGDWIGVIEVRKSAFLLSNWTGTLPFVCYSNI